MEKEDGEQEEAAPQQAKTRGPLHDALDEVIMRVERLMQSRGGKGPGIPTGFGGLDALTHGVRAGDVVVIAARPGEGKSTLLLNILEFMAVDCNRTVLAFMSETPEVDVVERLFFSRARKDYNSLFQPPCSLSPAEMKLMSKAVRDMRSCNFMLDDTTPPTLEAFCAKARQVKVQYPDLEVIGIDPLQMVRAENHIALESCRAEMEEIMHGLKRLAMELGVAVLAASHLNYPVASRHGCYVDMPSITDLPQADAIAQTADVVALLHRQPECGVEGQVNMALHVVKNRRGPYGLVPLLFQPNLHRFSPCKSDECDWND